MEVGALVTFQPAPGNGSTTILARVGVSFISSTQACENAKAEIPAFDFEGTHRASRLQWNELLGRIQVNMDGVPLDTVKLFYSSVRFLFYLFVCSSPL
jgi:putative alpha-1,2-mannosidase